MKVAMDLSFFPVPPPLLLGNLSPYVTSIKLYKSLFYFLNSYYLSFNLFQLHWVLKPSKINNPREL